MSLHDVTDCVTFVGVTQLFKKVARFVTRGFKKYIVTKNGLNSINLDKVTNLATLIRLRAM